MAEQLSSSKRKRIFIISTHPMFGHGLKKLLDQEPELNVIGYETDIERALTQIRESQPNVIIVESDKASSSRSATILSHLLKENLGATIISLSLQTNELMVYVTAHWMAKSMTDLVMAIQQEIPHTSTRPYE